MCNQFFSYLIMLYHQQSYIILTTEDIGKQVSIYMDSSFTLIKLTIFFQLYLLICILQLLITVAHSTNIYQS